MDENVTTRPNEPVFERLKQPVDRSRISTRDFQGTTLLYLEGYQAIELANDIFGFDGWATDVVSVNSTVNKEGKTVYWAVVRVTALGCTKTDVGCQPVAGDKIESHDMAIKGAVTDAMKRALRQFGNQFGNSLYSKDSPDNTEMKRGTRSTTTKPTTTRTMAVVAGPAIACEEEGCNNTLKGYLGKTGNQVTPTEQAENSRRRFGKALCGNHFMEAYKASQQAQET